MEDKIYDSPKPAKNKMGFKKRLTTDTPKWVKYVQGVLAAFAAYQAFVVVNPELLNIIPTLWAPKLAGVSAASAFFLQLINKK